MVDALAAAVVVGSVLLGVVLMMYGGLGRDRDVFGGSAIAGLSGRSVPDRRTIDRAHPPAKHPERVFRAGLGLVVGGVVVGVLWSVL
ncbi:MAG: hypothetical protein AAFZ07_25930 [Actinomycetota bacterium]